MSEGTPTSVSPSAQQLWNSARGPLLATLVLLLIGLALAAVRSDDRHGLLDPRSAKPHGSRAAAELLTERGVKVTIATTTAEAAASAGPNSTLLVAQPQLLSSQQLDSLQATTANGSGRTVLLAPGPGAIEALAPGVTVNQPSDVSSRQPGCALPDARRAGSTELGGFRYATSLPGHHACYLSDGLPTLLRLSAGEGGRDTVLLGSAQLLYNERLDHDGNASLALQLLGSHPHLVWYLPSLSDAAADDSSRSFYDLIPDGWHWAALQLGIAAALTALWRARRLGPLVPERLPVAVQASEATEGRARLYQRANARDRAADALRTAVRSRLAPLVGVSAAHAHEVQALCSAVSAHTGDDSGTVHSLLFGSVPRDDASLVRLADDLDRLERRITPTPTDKDRIS